MDQTNNPQPKGKFFAFENTKKRAGDTYSVGVDNSRITDGLELAELLMIDAYRLIAFYTEECPACTGGVFGVFGDRIVESAVTNPDGSLVERMLLDWAHAKEDNRLPAEMLHQALMRPKLRELLHECSERSGLLAHQEFVGAGQR